MSLLKNIFAKKDELIRDYTDFWNWFQKQESNFHAVVKHQKNIEKAFFNKISPKLSELREGYFYLTGMYDDDTVELIFTADGNIKNIVFVEELVDHAPRMNRWKFTALKPSLDTRNVNINMSGYTFNSENLFFYSNDLPGYPDEIDIAIVHGELNDGNKEQITNGIYIFLDNYLGELDFANNIDNIEVVSPAKAEKELIPIEKLKDFLNWRQKEFIEKYDGIRYDTNDDEHSILEAKLESGYMLIAVINTQLLSWSNKASHPWIAVVTIQYDGSRHNGMPDDKDYEKLNELEDTIMKELADKDGYLNIGRQTAKNEREIYFACKDFRKPSKLLYKVQKQFEKNFAITFDIYKDKYWRSFERFETH
ncbi:MAG: DUF695 domain-containing protein [Agriterribacter sp.]